MLLTLSKLRINYVLRLCPGMTSEQFGVGLGIGGVLSIVLTLVLTTTSLMFFGRVIELTGADLDEGRVHAAGIDPNSRPSNSPNAALVYLGARGLEKATKNRAGQVAIVAGAILLVVGAGYAFTLLELGFWGSFATMSAGIALPEELTKAAAGLLILYMMFETKSLSEVQFRRAVLAAFGIAGLGFGAGEALKYFGSYAQDGSGISWYIVRAVWCVTLHGAWTLIVGALLSTSLPKDPNALENRMADTFFMLLLACIPTVIAHGLYNAYCQHDEVLPWVVGGVSMVVAIALIEGFLEEKADDSSPKQQPA